MRREIRELDRLVAVHGQLIRSATQRVSELTSAIAACDQSWDLEIEKIDKLGSTTLLNTVAASARLRELRLRREQLARDVAAAEQELARLQLVVEKLGERATQLSMLAEEDLHEEMMEDWAPQVLASSRQA